MSWTTFVDLHAFGCKIVYMRAKVDRFFQKRAGLFILVMVTHMYSHSY
uniref:Uncharacterized protein n=1 Tax=Anguilla anguilla TaxID=7936 RepID=A0A0E9X0R4_ANGAN